MGMAAPLDFYTGDMVRALNKTEPRHWPRYETVHGELLVSPAPRAWHQEIVGRLYVALRLYLDREGVGHVFASPADISWGLPDVLIQPDIFVVPVHEARTLDWPAIRHLLLAVEVTSPASIRADRFTKRLVHQMQDTPCYWVIDSDARTAEVWSPQDAFPRHARDQLVWQPPAATSPFTITLATLFEPI